MAQTLAVRTLKLSHFRNYGQARLDVAASPVVLTGENGAGKTNLLEAVSMLAPGRGLRRAKTSEMDRVDGDGPWAVAAAVDSAVGPVDLGTGRDRDGERRIVRINGETVKSQAALGEYVSVVWLTPSMDRLFVEGSAGRRRFLDRLIYGFDGAHAGRLSAYEKALRDRARLLKDGVSDDAWLGALERQMAERGVAVAAARADMVRRLDRACAQGHGPFPGASVGLDGVIEGWLDGMPAAAVEDRFLERLRNSRRDDSDQGGAAVGPHKSDLTARHLVKDMPAHLCSTGEQKALLISIVLAHARLQAAENGTAPILLLDEVAAHLDADKRTALFDTLLDLPSQTWLTGTDAGVFAELTGKAQIFKVEAAAIHPA